MRLKDEIVKQVNNVAMRRNLTIKLDCSDQMFYKHLNDNKENGRLTKMDALKAIADELKIENVMDLLEETVTA
jgi:hypothetical protein